MIPDAPVERGTTMEVHCWRCKRKLGYFTAPWDRRCPRCKASNASEVID